ncbi:BamA/TamA family outer membrane protein [Longimicrobium sp.]|uniref:BamA/TamA family outer membrane protein n=1 Tax=Longimicrobium sp. TaxID=2029185 RepID=UPI002E31629B|nr:BamA/TamA family outer membrane protein [Longimicrobium sp.]HEX6040918.1 BamA/TamA family outer membrane protein [Longimicrobium sp.]
MSRSRRFPFLRPRALAVLAALGAAVVPAAAQEGERAPDLPPALSADADSSLAASDPLLCRSGATISEIFVDNGSVFDVGSEDLDARFNWAYRTANRMHVRTREGVIRRELLFREGDCYTPALLEDSERILRSLTFIADADVFAVRQPDGTYHVVVETRDEWSVRLEPQWDRDDGGMGITGVELREDNLLGSGQHVSAYFKEYQGERVYGANVGTRQLFHTQWDADLGVARTPVGISVVQRLAYPFRGESGRWAFREQIEHTERNFEIFVPREDGPGVQRRFFPESRRSADVGAVMRLGRRGNLTLFGLAVAGEWTEYPRDYLSTDGGGDQPMTRQVSGGDEPVPVVTGLDTVSSVRIVFLAGQRNVYFQRRRALDAVRGSEDVRLGVEAEVAVGRSVAAFSDDDDLMVDVGFSLAGAPVRTLVAGVRATASGRRDFGADPGAFEWRSVFGQADAWAYWRPSDASRHTVVASASMVGGWRTTVPFQLTLGNRAGLRGFPSHAYPGERRLVGTLEHRMYLGWPYPRLFDLGTAAFVDVGKMWAGGDTFGVNSPWATSAGLGLRLAFPPGSRRTYRLDIAVPVNTRGYSARDVVFTLGVGQAVGRSQGDDPQLRRSNRRAVAASLFNFPN